MPTDAERHIVLLVEDDPHMAAITRDVIEAMGHECVHVETQQEALQVAEKQPFCYALLDLQIKTKPGSVVAREEAGRTLLRQLRKRFLDRTAEGKHRTQLMILSAYAHTVEQTRVLMQLGADDVLIKPITDNHPSIEQRIRVALRHAERTNHARCQFVAPEHSAEQPASPTVTPYPATDDEYEALVKNTTLLIDRRTRSVFYCGQEIPTSPNGKSAHLQKQPLAVLTVLAMHPGVQMSEAELNEHLFRQGLLDDNVGTRLRSIRQRILKPFRDALGEANHSEVRELVQVTRGLGRISLSAPGDVRVLEA